MLFVSPYVRVNKATDKPSLARSTKCDYP